MSQGLKLYRVAESSFRTDTDTNIYTVGSLYYVHTTTNDNNKVGTIYLCTQGGDKNSAVFETYTGSHNWKDGPDGSVSCSTFDVETAEFTVHKLSSSEIVEFSEKYGISPQYISPDDSLGDGGVFEVSITEGGTPICKIFSYGYFMDDDENYVDSFDIVSGQELSDGTYYYNRIAGDAASGSYAILTGCNTVASGEYSHAEGYGTVASGYSSHTEGHESTASGEYSHAEGEYNIASGDHSHVEGKCTVASGEYSHAEGDRTQAFNDSEHASGICNVSHQSDDIRYQTISSIGAGTYNYENDEIIDRKNAVEVTRNGDVYILGIGDYDGANLEESLPVYKALEESERVIAESFAGVNRRIDESYSWSEWEE